MTTTGPRTAWVREAAATRVRIARLVPHAGAGLAAASAAANFFLGLLPVVFAIATSVMLGRLPAAIRGGMASGAWRSALTLFTVAAAAFGLQQIVSPLVTSLGELVARRIDGRVFGEVMAASLGSTGVGPLEDQRLLDDLREAADALEFYHQSPGQACAGMLALIARYTQLTSYAVVIGVVFSWLAAAGLVTAVLVFRYGQRGGLRKILRLRASLARQERKANYFRQLSIEPAAGKEIRVFGLAGWLRDALEEAHRAWLEPLWVKRRAIYVWPFLVYTAWALAVAGVSFAVIGATAGGTLTLTSFVLVMQAGLGALRLGDVYPEADMQTAVGGGAYTAVKRFAAGVAAFPAAPPAGGGAAFQAEPPAGGGAAFPAEAPAAGSAVSRRMVPGPAATIAFEKITFGYPGQARPVLRDLDLTIPAGRCTAIVGLNGAGKTTLVKLLARLHEPAKGVVRADGVDIRCYPVSAWRDKLSIVFQDFVHFEASARDNIGLGAPGSLGDSDGIRAAAQAAGIAAALEELPRGMDTPLARHLTGGVDLSGGQWQRIALARALFALGHGASIVVLDEPTANLDVRAEARFFDEFASLTRSATTLLISHRFSTVRHADLIIVLDQGQVAEQGSHGELLAHGGQYARMFRLQAHRFGGTAHSDGSAASGDGRADANGEGGEGRACATW